uniref:Immunoglobulin-like domain-containing receptor 2 n=1 Tax=Poecilia reticulata TaxID=8081 RepID=A0A3P9Q5Y8_POERE
MWRIFILFLAGVIPPPGSGLHVVVRDEKRYSTLFQSVVLPCQYTSVSTQPAMVKWIYKSYCRDRTRDSFSFPDSLGGGGLQSGSGGVGGGYDAGSTASHLDCSDNRRTVRTVASISGSSVTLSEYYKNRDVTIINTADLRIGEVQWGDSGVYFCQVTIADDIEGQNEASVELLVLGFSGVPEDLLPDIDLKIMPEWAFVVAVVLGSVLFLLLVGVCWCQCCPHSCCCYVSCWCCPDTCCCPRHLYEAGKGIKTGASTPQTPAYPPYFVSGLPAMIPIAPPSLVDKVSTVAPSDGTLVAAVSPMPVQAVGIPYRVPSPQDQNSLRVLQYVEKQLAHFNPSGSNSKQSCNQSELSSLHEGDTNFHQTFRNVQKKALPAIPDQDSGPEPHGYHENRSPDLQRHPRTSLCFHGDTATTRHLPLSRTGLVEVRGSRTRVMKTNTTGGTLVQNICRGRRITLRDGPSLWMSWRSLLPPTRREEEEEPNGEKKKWWSMRWRCWSMVDIPPIARVLLSIITATGMSLTTTVSMKGIPEQTIKANTT